MKENEESNNGKENLTITSINDVVNLLRMGIEEGISFSDFLDTIISIRDQYNDFYTKLQNLVPFLDFDNMVAGSKDTNNIIEWQWSAFGMQMLRAVNPSGIAYDFYIDSIKKLEKEIGKIVFVPAIQEITDQNHKDRYLSYFFERTQNSELMTGMGYAVNYHLKREIPKIKEKWIIDPELDNVDKVINIIARLIIANIEDQSKVSNKQIIDRYILIWEFVFNNFLEPIFIAMRKSGTIPDVILKEWKRNHKIEPVDDSRLLKASWYRFPRYLQVKAINHIFEKFEFCEPLRIWTKGLDIELRNALIHEKFYLENNTIYYYFISKGKSVFREKTIDELDNFNHSLFMNILIIPRIIGMMLVEEHDIFKELFKEKS